MRVIERQGNRGDDHFTEGEPDLEPPEELAVLEVDEEALLEEDLDNQTVLEDEVDEDVLENSLDHLVHDGDDAEGAEGTGAEANDVDDLEIEDLEDREESLDRILREKLAGDEEPAAEVDDLLTADGTGATGPRVPACGPDEFVCPSCFLVRNRTQQAAAPTSLCRDCTG